MSTGKIKTLFSDPNKTEIVYPKTKLNAISDNDGIGLEAILSTTVHAGAGSDDDVVTTIPNDAETLGGLPADYFIGKEEVENNYATKEELKASQFEVQFITWGAED